MKYRAIDKVLLVVLSLLLIAISVALLCMAIGFITKDMLTSVLGQAYSGFWAALVLGIIGVVLLIFTFRVMIAFLGKPTDPKYKSAVVAAGEYGTTYITLSAIDAMVQRHCKNEPQIKECVSNVQPSDGGVKLALKLVAQNDVSVPELTGKLQQNLKEYVESLSGIAIKDIKILVAAPTAPKAG